MKGTKPTKILVGGDRQTAQRFIGPANSQMEILKKQMSFQDRSQGVRRIWLHDDVYVECLKCFNYQECKIWVRPVVQEGEEKEKQENPVYFYVRIVCEEDGREMDRIIIWRIKEENKGDTIPNTSYIDSGTLEDGRAWGIINEGAIILDVDVKKGEVYSESGGVSVETTLNEEDQLAIAQRYKDSMTGGNKPPELLPNYISGPICSPLELSSFCEHQRHPTPDGEYYFNDPTPSSSYSSTPEWVDFYHMNREPMDIIKWEDCCYVDPDECIHCYSPEHTFTTKQWPKLDENFDKYPPTNRSAVQYFYDPICNLLPCGLVLSSNPGYDTVYGGAGMEYVPGGSALNPWYWATCVSPNDGGGGIKQGEHKNGSYFTTEDTFPCFFVTEYGIAENQYTSRIAYVSDDVQSDGTACFGGAPAMSYRAYVSVTDVTHYVSTPLELIEPAEFISGQPGNPCNETINLYNWLNGGNGAITVRWNDDNYGVWSGFPLSALPPGVNFGNSGLEGVEINTISTDKYFTSSLQSAKHIEKNAVALTVFSDRSLETTGAGDTYLGPLGSGFAICNGVDPDTVDPVEGYQTGMVFYIMLLTFLSRETKSGGAEYWDIHSEREANSNEINHNRLLDLEDYVNAILTTLKQDGVDNGTNGLLENRGYSIQTGFVYQLH